MDHVISALAWIAAFGVVIALVVQLFRNRRHEAESRSWPVTQATVQSGAMEIVGRGRTAVTRPCFAFSYVVNSEYYSGRFYLLGCDDRSATLIREMVDKQLSVHYNPAKPEDFVLPGVSIEGCRILQLPE